MTHSYVIIDEGVPVTAEGDAAGYIVRRVTGEAHSYVKGRKPRKTYAYVPMRNGQCGFKIADYAGGMDVKALPVCGTDSGDAVRALRGTQNCGCCKATRAVVFAATPEEAVSKYLDTLPLGAVTATKTDGGILIASAKHGRIALLFHDQDITPVVEIAPVLSAGSVAFSQWQDVMGVIEDHFRDPVRSRITRQAEARQTEGDVA